MMGEMIPVLRFSSDTTGRTCPWFYERDGEKRVGDGHYTRVLRYDEHLVPLAEALSRYAEDSVLRSLR